MRKLVSSGSYLENPIGFSRACRIGGQIAISGTAPISEGKTAFIGDVYGQTKLCLDIAVTALKEAGGLLPDVIRTRIMLVDIKRWEDAARAHGELFSDIRPACTFVEVKGFIDSNWLVEIEMDAVVSGS
ncbi:RidA family protein [Microbulbifer sp. SSSA005]|uniref:RidA family protein n=1 Tax=unclassified Microbulbifer TaxID=2619833 RepID=UPI00403A00C7